MRFVADRRNRKQAEDISRRFGLSLDGFVDGPTAHVDFVLCGDGHMRGDDAVHAFCADCHAAITHTTYAPPKADKLCLRCTIKRLEP